MKMHVKTEIGSSYIDSAVEELYFKVDIHLSFGIAAIFRKMAVLFVCFLIHSLNVGLIKYVYFKDNALLQIGNNSWDN